MPKRCWGCDSECAAEGLDSESTFAYIPSAPQHAIRHGGATPHRFILERKQLSVPGFVRSVVKGGHTKRSA